MRNISYRKALDNVVFLLGRIGELQREVSKRDATIEYLNGELNRYEAPFNIKETT